MVLKEHKVYAKNTWNKILKDSYKGVHKILTVGETYLLYADYKKGENKEYCR